MIGSLLKVWPWKNPGVVEGVDFPTDPFTYEQISGNPSYIGYAVVYAIIGLVLVFGIEFLAVKAQKNK